MAFRIDSVINMVYGSRLKELIGRDLLTNSEYNLPAVNQNRLIILLYYCNYNTLNAIVHKSAITAFRLFVV